MQREGAAVVVCDDVSFLHKSPPDNVLVVIDLFCRSLEREIWDAGVAPLNDVLKRITEELGKGGRREGDVDHARQIKWLSKVVGIVVAGDRKGEGQRFVILIADVLSPF